MKNLNEGGTLDYAMAHAVSILGWRAISGLVQNRFGCSLSKGAVYKRCNPNQPEYHWRSLTFDQAQAIHGLLVKAGHDSFFADAFAGDFQHVHPNPHAAANLATVAHGELIGAVSEAALKAQSTAAGITACAHDVGEVQSRGARAIAAIKKVMLSVARMGKRGRAAA